MTTRVPESGGEDTFAPTVKAYVVMFDRAHPGLRYSDYGPFWSRRQAEEWVTDLPPVRQIVSWHIVPMGDPDREPRRKRVPDTSANFSKRDYEGGMSDV